MKIFTIVGTRPNFIKVDPELSQTLIHTGQHYDYRMNKIFFKELNLPDPLTNLHCKGDEVGKMVDKLGQLFKKECPDMVIVFGDTNSALAGALAAAYQNIKIAHIEAGLRSFRKDMPEELNRVIIDRISTIRFCPDLSSNMNLLKEGIKDNIYIVGDPSFDTLNRFTPIPKSKNYKRYILLTMHRNFNADNKEVIERILEAIATTEEKVIFPIHLRTARNIERFDIKIPKQIKVTEPESYKKMLNLISNAKKVITDSGGVQREAYWMNVPVIILRDETEWLEIITKKAGILVGNDFQKIIDAINNFNGSLNPPPIFGANKRIREILYRHL